MSENTSNGEEPPSRLPSTEQWRNRVRYALRVLERDARRFRDLTLPQAPADLNTPHLDYMLRPGYVDQGVEAITAIGTALYQIEVQARYRRHRPDDQADLQAARKALSQAARHLHRVSRRARGTL